MTHTATTTPLACPNCGSTLVARVRSNRTGRDYLADFDKGQPAPWLPHFKHCRPAERAAIIALAQSFGLVKAVELFANLRQFDSMHLVGETTRLVDEGVFATDGKHFWLTGDAPAVPAAAPQARAAAAIEAGYYLLDGRVYKVQISKSNDKPYAKILNTEGRFDYAPRAVRDLRPEHQVTLEQAREWGRINGRCMICAAELTNPESIEYGIGPVCRKRLAPR